MKTTPLFIAILVALVAVERGEAITVIQSADIAMNPDAGMPLPPPLNISLFKANGAEVVAINEFKFELQFGIGNIGTVTVGGTDLDLFTGASGYTQTYEGSSGFFSLTGIAGFLIGHAASKPEYFRWDYSGTTLEVIDLDIDGDGDPMTGGHFQYTFNTPTGSTLRLVEGTATLSGESTVSAFTPTGNEWVNGETFVLSGSTPEPSRAALSLLAITATLLRRRRRT